LPPLADDSALKRLLRRHEIGLLLATGVAVLVTALVDPQHNYYYEPGSSAQNILRQAALLGIFALGSAVVIIAGGIDLSSGSVIAFSGTVCASLILILAPEAIQAGGVPKWVLAGGISHWHAARLAGGPGGIAPLCSHAGHAGGTTELCPGHVPGGDRGGARLPQHSDPGL